VAEFPLRERLRGQLMLALYRCGRQAEALEAYQDARRTLVDTLGIEPSARLQELERAILRQEEGLAPIPAAPVLADHFHELLEALIAGRLVPVVGSLVGLPEPGEVADHLAERFGCPRDNGSELARIGQYVAVTRGVGPLHDELHTLFDEDREPGAVHRLLARLPAFLREQGAPMFLVVTTNFDRAMERAFVEAGEQFDVVSYLSTGPYRGSFLHLGPDGRARIIDVPNTYTELDPEERPVLLKMHGQVQREPARELESFVVSEDDYIDYLALSGIARLPVTLAAKLRHSHFLFLGYESSQWPFRVFLHRVWGEERGRYRSWAVAPHPEPLARELWRHLGVDLLDIPFTDYLAEVEDRVVGEREAAGV
jgi:transcriptional activator/SIR2-like protein